MIDGPDEIVVGVDRRAVYSRTPQFCAVRNGDDTDAVATIEDMAGDRFVVYRSGSQPAAARPLLPVYSAGHHGPLAVATGRVFVRLEVGQDAKACANDFVSAGFEVDRVLSYAPHAVWLRPLDGDVNAALNGVETLARLSGVVNVEPQVLLERSEK